MASAPPLRSPASVALAGIRPNGRALRASPRLPSAPRRDDPPRLLALSPREQQIVRLVAKGLVNKTIGHVLDISPWTVSTHVRRIFAKLGVASRASMVAAVYETERPAALPAGDPPSWRQR